MLIEATYAQSRAERGENKCVCVCELTREHSALRAQREYEETWPRDVGCSLACVLFLSRALALVLCLYRKHMWPSIFLFSHPFESYDPQVINRHMPHMINTHVVHRERLLFGVYVPHMWPAPIIMAGHRGTCQCHTFILVATACARLGLIRPVCLRVRACIRVCVYYLFPKRGSHIFLLYAFHACVYGKPAIVWWTKYSEAQPLTFFIHIVIVRVWYRDIEIYKYIAYTRRIIRFYHFATCLFFLSLS